MRLGPVDHLTALVPALEPELAAWLALGAQLLQRQSLPRARALKLGQTALADCPCARLRLGVLVLQLLEVPDCEPGPGLGWSALHLPGLGTERTWRSPAGIQVRGCDPGGDEGLGIELVCSGPLVEVSGFYLGLGALGVAADERSLELRGAARIHLLRAPEGVDPRTPQPLAAGLWHLALHRSDHSGRRSPGAEEGQLLSGPSSELLELL